MYPAKTAQKLNVSNNKAIENHTSEPINSKYIGNEPDRF